MPEQSADLRRRVLLVGAPLAALTIIVAAFIAVRLATRQLEDASARTTATAAQRSAETVDLYLRERWASLRLLVSVPAVIEHARTRGLQATAQGLDALAIPDLESRFASTGAFQPDAQLDAFLARVRDDSDFAEVFFTERHGFIVGRSNPTSDFVQSDEEWWQRAFEIGEFQDEPEFDESAGTAALGMAMRIEAAQSGEALGVVKGVLDLSRLAFLLAAPRDTVAIEVHLVDAAGRVVAAADPSRLLQPLPDAGAIPRETQTSVRVLRGRGSSQFVASSPANAGRWWVVVRESADTSTGAVAIQRVIITGSGILLALVLTIMLWLSSWLHRRITRPVQAAGIVTRRVADGDLSLSVTERAAGAREVEELLQSVEAMVQALRTLVGQIRSASEESAAMAQEISASTEEMSASTQEMANTCQSLTAQATEEANTVREAAAEAAHILQIATNLAGGAREAASRSSALTELASGHRERLVSGGELLRRLASDLEQGAEDAQALARMSEEIQSFVKQAREIGAQTNMLALNAAIEASRAGGGETRGFAVVADEVRKLATQASRAAAATSETVRNVLATVEATTDRLSRLVESSSAVREIAESAAAGLADVAHAAGETSEWTDDISRAASDLRRLVEGITRRLEVLAQGTEGVVAAAEEIAASAQEQSASTQEIASSASHLAESTERLTSAVSSFTVGRDVRRVSGVSVSPID